MLLIVQSRGIKCLLGSGLLSIMGSTVKVEDTVLPLRELKFNRQLICTRISRGCQAGYNQSATWLTTNHPEGKEWITVDSAAKWLQISRILSMAHLFSFKLKIIPALYQVHGNNLSNMQTENLELLSLLQICADRVRMRNSPVVDLLIL